MVDALPDRYTLTDVACPEPGACVAVGRLGTLATTSEAVVLRQDGACVGARPVAAAPARRAGVSCVAPDDCLVLGALDLRYHDGELTVLAPPPLDGEAVRAALDCVPGGGCLQVDERVVLLVGRHRLVLARAPAGRDDAHRHAALVRHRHLLPAGRHRVGHRGLAHARHRDVLDLGRHRLVAGRHPRPPDAPARPRLRHRDGVLRHRRRARRLLDRPAGAGARRGAALGRGGVDGRGDRVPGRRRPDRAGHGVVLVGHQLHRPVGGRASRRPPARPSSPSGTARPGPAPPPTRPAPSPPWPAPGRRRARRPATGCRSASTAPPGPTSPCPRGRRRASCSPPCRAPPRRTAWPWAPGWDAADARRGAAAHADAPALRRRRLGGGGRGRRASCATSPVRPRRAAWSPVPTSAASGRGTGTARRGRRCRRSPTSGWAGSPASRAPTRPGAC